MNHAFTNLVLSSISITISAILRVASVKRAARARWPAGSLKIIDKLIHHLNQLFLVGLVLCLDVLDSCHTLRRLALANEFIKASRRDFVRLRLYLVVEPALPIPLFEFRQVRLLFFRVALQCLFMVGILMAFVAFFYDSLYFSIGVLCWAEVLKIAGVFLALAANDTGPSACV
jgi:hypothetical protein